MIFIKENTNFKFNIVVSGIRDKEVLTKVSLASAIVP